MEIAADHRLGVEVCVMGGKQPMQQQREPREGNGGMGTGTQMGDMGMNKQTGGMCM